MEETVIEIDNLKKMYRLGAIGGGTLRGDLQSWWARVRGQEDPNKKLGQEDMNIGEAFLALDGINLKVKKGEAVGIIGHNGAGKSTLLKILSRVTAPTEGVIKMKGRVSSMLEVGTGFHPELSGRENIYLNGAILGMSRKEVDSKMDEIIEFSECGKFIDTPVKRYSSGMYVKLAFAVAAHLDAEIMVMDEVLAVGDMKFQRKCLGKMENAATNEGKTVLYVSHNMTTIRQLCTRCIVLDHGKLIFDGDVEEAINIYMDQDKHDFKVDYDFKDVKRPSYDHGIKVFIEKFKFLNKEEAVFDRYEPLRFQIQYASHADIENLRLYYTVEYLDTTIAGTTQSLSFGDAIDGTSQTKNFSMDISNLIPGVYSFYIDVFSMNEYYNSNSYDRPMEKIYFEVTENEGNKGINWQRRYYGNVELNPILVES